MHYPIGLVDSGFGGLTVMREVTRLLPRENLIYLADTAHLPYGDKAPEAVVQFSQENASFLMKQNIKLLIVACHTACAHGLQVLQKTLPIPVIGMIQPGVELVRRYQRIAVLGTVGTIESGIYQTLIRQQNPSAIISSLACPLFVPLIEEGFYDHFRATLIARRYLAQLHNSVDAALLACTHYPLIAPILQNVLGDEVALLEPAAMCAQHAKSVLSDAGLLNAQLEHPTYQFYVTHDPEKFRRLGTIFFGSKIDTVEKLEIGQNLCPDLRLRLHQTQPPRR